MELNRVGDTSGGLLAGWVARLRLRFLVAVVPAAAPNPSNASSQEPPAASMDQEPHLEGYLGFSTGPAQ